MICAARGLTTRPQWEHYRQRLASRGLIDSDGALTGAGRDLKQRIEDATTLALSRSTRSTTTKSERLFLRSRPITRKVVAAVICPRDSNGLSATTSRRKRPPRLTARVRVL